MRLSRIPLSMARCPCCQGALGVVIDPIDRAILEGLAQSLDSEPGDDGGASAFWHKHLTEEHAKLSRAQERDPHPSEDLQCRACAAVFRRSGTLLSLESPPGASVRGEPSMAPFDPASVVTNEVAGFVGGVTFAELRARLATMFTASTIRDRYLRAYIARGIKGGLIRSSIDPDGTVRYHRLGEPDGGR
jgi:hypothetical protein